MLPSNIVPSLPLHPLLSNMELPLDISSRRGPTYPVLRRKRWWRDHIRSFFAVAVGSAVGSDADSSTRHPSTKKRGPAPSNLSSTDPRAQRNAGQGKKRIHNSALSPNTASVPSSIPTGPRAPIEPPPPPPRPRRCQFPSPRLRHGSPWRLSSSPPLPHRHLPPDRHRTRREGAKASRGDVPTPRRRTVSSSRKAGPPPRSRAYPPTRSIPPSPPWGNGGT
mmetsp:Transcript_34840/g.103891  ORF Transcript_34840/g.103891 Transcript_34840/m.103891 type:complete len:221 (-) Transcript_34840:2109-2771(-)